MVCGGMSYLPLTLVALSAGTFIVTYVIAILNHDVSAVFPYISDTGTKPPESCIFGQFLNISAALCLCTVYVRYKLVETISGHEGRSLHRLNMAGLCLGIVTATGLSMVANFQETAVEAVHVTGAGLVFGIGVVYAAIQTGLTYHMYPTYNGIRVAHVRLLLTIISFCAMGYVAHLVSTVAEWVTALAFLVYFLTFSREFVKIRLEVKPHLSVQHLDETPHWPDERTGLLSGMQT